MLISLFDLVNECPHLERNIGEVYRAFSSSVLNAKFLAFSTPKKKKIETYESNVPSLEWYGQVCYNI